MRNDFKNLTFEELVQKREELSNELMEMKFKSVLGQVEKPIFKRVLRRQIARIHTRLYELQLKEIENEGND